MKKILITGAGGSPAVNFTRSLRTAPEKMYLIGTDSNKYYLQRAETDERYLVPSCKDENYIPILQQIIKETRAEFLHVQNDQEMEILSEQREKLGIMTFLPSKETVRICLDKLKSYQRWAAAGIKQPRTMLLRNEDDLHLALKEFGGKIWIRDTTGAGGRGSLPVNDLKIAKAWLDFKEGWNKYTAAQCLEPNSVTWMSIWNQGKLVVAQGRKRLYWELSKVSPSGISGATGGAVTVSDLLVDTISQLAIFAIDAAPHGIFSVDLTYDKEDIPNPTEINIGRFFTTHEFFTQAGLNLPFLLVKLAYDEPLPTLSKKINPLPENKVWIRGMDFLPVLTTTEKISEAEKSLQQRRQKILIDQPSTKILVTGLTGHIGLELFKTLTERKYAITALLRHHSEATLAWLQKYSIPFIICDLANQQEVAAHAKTLAQFTQVLHCAGYVPKTAAEDHEEKSREGNLTATMNIVQCLAKNTHFIFLSTCEVYGFPDQIPISEDCFLQPKSNYSISKMEAEKYLQSYCAKKEITLTILRLTNIYGPGEKIERAIPNFIKAILRGKKPVIYGDGTDIRDLLYLSDAIEYIIAALEKRKEGIFNIASGKGISIKELAEKMITLSGKKIEIEFQPRVKPRVDFIFDIHKAEQDLGYTPQITIEHGLQKEMEWFRNI